MKTTTFRGQKNLEHHFSSSLDWKSYIKETSQLPYMFYKAKVKNYGKSDKPIEFIISCMVLTGCQENGAPICRTGRNDIFFALDCYKIFSILQAPRCFL